MKLSKIAGLALAASVIAFTAGAQDRVLRVAPAAPPPHPANGYLYQGFARYLPEESAGRMGATILGPEVVNLVQMKDALQSQVAEVGNLLPLFFPADLPNMALAGELSLTSSNSHAAGAAMTEYIVNCEPCQAEMRAFGFVYLGSGASDVYELLTTRPVRTAADLQGLLVVAKDLQRALAQRGQIEQPGDLAFQLQRVDELSRVFLDNPVRAGQPARGPVLLVVAHQQAAGEALDQRMVGAAGHVFGGGLVGQGQAGKGQRTQRHAKGLEQGHHGHFGFGGCDGAAVRGPKGVEGVPIW